MLKRIILPTFSLIFLGIVYLSLFFQAIANQYQTHFLTYRLSYLFIAIGMSFIHVITILHTPSIKKAVLELFYSLEGQIWRREENVNNMAYNSNMSTQQQQRREEQMAILGLQTNKFDTVGERNIFQLTQISCTDDEELLKQTDTDINSMK